MRESPTSHASLATVNTAGKQKGHGSYIRALVGPTIYRPLMRPDYGP